MPRASDPPAEPPRGISPRNAGRDALIAWAAVAALVTLLVQINVTLPLVGHLGSALVAVLFLYAPVFAAWRRREDLDDYGFHAEPLGRGLATAGIAVAIIIPVFALAYFAFYEIACHSSLLAHVAPRNLCSRYGGLVGMHAPKLDLGLAEYCAGQLVVVALPEELFFRGFLLGLLEQRFPPKRRILGGGVGLALLVSALAFALIHLPRDGDPRALATFFPGLVFGWMRSATRSILAGTVTHASCNILVHVLDAAVMR